MRKFFKTGCLIFIIPIITGVISGVITSKVENINFISAMGVVIEKVFSFIQNVLTFKIPVWIIIILFFIIIGIIKLLILINNKDNETKTKEVKRVFRDYTEDYYDGIKYRWKWYETSNGIRITNLHPICECGCDLVYDMFDSYIECPDCKKNFRNKVDEDSAERVFANRYRKRLEQFKKDNV